MKRSMMKFSLVAGLTAFAAFGLSETYAVCMGINAYKAPVDEKGSPLKDEKGNPVSNELFGAVNDANSYRDLIVNQYKVKPENVHLVLDADAGIDGFIKEMQWMVEKAKPGDQIIFTFSGHGASVADKSKESGKSSVIVLSDYELIPGSFFKKLSTNLKSAGINATYVFDSCFSGGMSRVPATLDGQAVSARPRFTTKIGSRAKVETDASVFKKLTLIPRGARTGAVQGEIAFLFASTDQQTSSDIQFKDPSKKSHGLFTLMLVDILNKRSDFGIGEVVTAINEFISTKTEFKQRPSTEFSNEERSKRPLIFDN